MRLLPSVPQCSSPLALPASMRSLKRVRHQQAKALVKLPHRGNLGHSGVGDSDGRCSAWIPLGAEFFGSVAEAIDELDTAIGTRGVVPRPPVHLDLRSGT